MKNKKFNFRDLVIRDGRLIGDWDNLYKKEKDPWLQSEAISINDTKRLVSIQLCERLRIELARAGGGG